MMSSHLTLPRNDHLDLVLYSVAYLQKDHNTALLSDLSDPGEDPDEFELKAWSSSVFGNVQGKDKISPNMPKPHGIGFSMRAKVDASHASDKVLQ